jgi:hypothetical protein
MGKESRDREGQETIGKYNVCITLLFAGEEGMMQESINCKTWNHAGQFLALSLFDGTIRIVCLEQYHGFIISPIKHEESENEESSISH